MSTAIIRDENTNKIWYCKDHSYPTGLGFALLNANRDQHNIPLPERHDMLTYSTLVVEVAEVPKDIQYEYIIKGDGTVTCQECWWTNDVNYNGGGFRHGGIYDLNIQKEKVKLQKEYTYRRPEDWM